MEIEHQNYDKKKLIWDGPFFNLGPPERQCETLQAIYFLKAYHLVMTRTWLRWTWWTWTLDMVYMDMVDMDMVDMDMMYMDFVDIYVVYMELGIMI